MQQHKAKFIELKFDKTVHWNAGTKCWDSCPKDHCPHLWKISLKKVKVLLLNVYLNALDK